MILESVFLRFLCVIYTIITESPPLPLSWKGGGEEYKAIIIISILMAIRVDEMYFFKALTIRKKFLIHFYYHKVLKTYSNNSKQN